MKGYINLFEGDCTIVGIQETYNISEGCKIRLTSGKHSGNQAIIRKLQNKWIIEGDGFTIFPVQGTEVSADTSDTVHMSKV